MGETPLFHVERLRDLKQSLWIALIFIFLRGCMNRITKKKLEATRKKRGLKVEVDKLQEEIWLVVCGTLFSICSGYLISNSPNFKGCNLFKTSECYAAFTTATGDVPKEIKIYYLTEVGWYLSLMTKSLFGVGRFDSFVMEFHHVITLGLVIWSYTTGFTQRIGVIIFFIFNQSNPLLHLSKLTNYMEWKTSRVYLFLLFASVFFVSRIILLPLIGIRSTFFEMKQGVTEEAWNGAVVYTWCTTNSLLVALWLLNIYWLQPIIRVIKRNLSGMDGGRPQDDTVTIDNAKTK